MIESNFPSYLPLSTYFHETEDKSILLCLNGSINKDDSWSRVIGVIGKGHKHVYRHANSTDIKLPSERKNLWSDATSDNFGTLVENCVSCRATAAQQPFARCQFHLCHAILMMYCMLTTFSELNLLFTLVLHLDEVLSCTCSIIYIIK